MKTSGLVFFIAFGAVSAFIITALLRGWLTKRRAIASLITRDQVTDEQFGRRFSSNINRADVAIRVRRVLSSNLEMPLDGLQESDRLNEDLNAELPANPHLFWELEAEFGIQTDVEDLETFERVLERLITFQDLVEYVESKISERRAEALPKNADEESSRAYEFAIRSIPILCIGGFSIAVWGAISQRNTLIGLGGLIFLLGFSVWGLANGGELLRYMIRAARGTSLKEIASRPLPWILVGLLALFFLWVGGTFLWALLKGVLNAR